MRFPPYVKPGSQHPDDPQPPDPLEDLAAEYADRMREKTNGAGGNGVDHGDIGEPPNFPEEPQATPLDGADWLRLAQRTQAGSPIPNLYNALLPLRHDPQWRGQFGFDEMAYDGVLHDQPLSDPDRYRIREWMQIHGLPRAGTEDVRQALEIVCREHAFHPLRAQLDGLAYDGVPRITDWLTTYLGVAASAYAQAVGPMFLVAMVARIYQPGCQADYMLILEGDQGIQKSQACRILGGDYFSNTLPDLAADPIRLSMHLRGKWIVEVPELHQFFNSKVDLAHLKAFLTIQTEQYTPKFGRGEVREPRQCLFIGTTNEENYLRDHTGARRFWPVRCGTIDLEALERDRDQLLAEAIEAYRRGTHWWPDPGFEARYIKPEQDQRYQGDAWETAIEEWDFTDCDRDSNGKPVYRKDQFGELYPAPRRKLDPPYYLREIASGALNIETQRLTKRDEMRLTTVLASLRWARATRSNRGVPWWPPSS